MSTAKPTTVDLITDAARASFLTCGYENTSMDAIARDANVSKATLYAHFESKDALFVSVMQSVTLHYQSQLVALANEKGGTFFEQLTRAGTSVLLYLLDPATLKVFRVIISASSRIPHICKQMISHRRQESRAMVSAIFKEGLENGTLIDHNPDDAAKLFLGVLKDELLWDSLMVPNEVPGKDEIINYARKIVTQVARLYMKETSATGTDDASKPG